VKLQGFIAAAAKQLKQQKGFCTTEYTENTETYVPSVANVKLRFLITGVVVLRQEA